MRVRIDYNLFSFEQNQDTSLQYFKIRLVLTVELLSYLLIRMHYCIFLSYNLHLDMGISLFLV